METAKCPKCGQVYEVPEKMIGSTARCSQCDTRFVVPDPSAAEPEVAPVSEEPSVTPSRLLRRRRRSSLFNSDPLMLAKLLLGVGLVIVILARGCDSIGQRGVARSQAKVAAEQARFNEKWEDTFTEKGLAAADLGKKEREFVKAMRAKQSEFAKVRRPKEQREQHDREMSDLRERHDREMSELRKRRDELSEEQDKEREELERGRWRGLLRARRNASVNNQLWSYWREWAFVLGSVALMAGCIWVGFAGSGAERLVCLVMVAIITFSIYIAGVAWVSSIASTMKAL